MNDLVRWMKIVAFLLVLLIAQVLWVGVQLLTRPAVGAQVQPKPMPVYIVDPIFDYPARVSQSGFLFMVPACSTCIPFR